MDKVAVVAKILEECVLQDVVLVAKQIDIILGAMQFTHEEKELLAGKMLAWCVERLRMAEENDYGKS